MEPRILSSPGVYATEEQAKLAIQRLLTRPGFRDHPGGFSIDCYELNKDHWPEGFIHGECT
jgi:hypothetical protein